MRIFEYRKQCIGEIFACLSKRLTDYQYNDAVLDTDILISFVLKKTRAWILTHRDEELTCDELQSIDKLITKRKNAVPIAYITGRKEFYGLDFAVDERVLIPKSDTEILVEEALTFCSEAIQHSDQESFSILDLCSGSGCIGIALVKNLYTRCFTAQVHTTRSSNDKSELTLHPARIALTLQDISPDTLALARENAQRILHREIETGHVTLRLLCKDLRDGTDGSYECVVSNPPYVPSSVTSELLKDGRREPRIALDGGADGLALFPKLADTIFDALRNSAAFFVEAGEYNIDNAKKIFGTRGFLQLKTFFDLHELPRVFSGIKPERSDHDRKCNDTKRHNAKR